MKISIIGSGYVGLVTGLCFAEKKYKVICVDNDKTKVRKINNGNTIIFEKGLDKLLSKNLNKNFTITSNLEYAVINSDITFIAVGTPFHGNSIDLSQVKEAAKSIGKILLKKKDYHLIIVKSTVIPGTTDNTVSPIIEKYSKKKLGEEFGVGMNPEFLREGSAVNDFMKPDRIVAGCNEKHSADIIRRVYKPFNKAEILVTNNKTAEMIKYANNTLLATLISFSNEIGNLCSSIENVDSLDVMKGVHFDNRISPVFKSKKIFPGIISYLNPGCGFGGSCFPKDLSAIISFGDKQKEKMSLLKTVRSINKLQPSKIVKIIKKKFNNNLNDKKIAILGLAFKEGTDDMRESPSIPIISTLLANKANIIAYDPVAAGEAKKIFSKKKIKYSRSLTSVVKNVEAVVILTPWPEFKNLHKIISRLKVKPLIIDGRRVLNKNDFSEYFGIGIK